MGAQERSHLTDAGTACGLGARDHSMCLCSLALGTMPLTAMAGMRPSVWGQGTQEPSPFTSGTNPNDGECEQA